MTTLDDEIGKTIGGKYRIDSVLGQGGMGTVYLATQIPERTKVALKILSKNHLFSEVSRRRFEIEGRASHALNHPSLVRVLDFDISPDDAPYIAMEYVSGISLHDVLKERKTIDIEQALRIFDQVCDGLSYAHHNHVIHRDIKPSNIMISPSGNAKVVDFGLAKIVHEDRGEVQALTQTGEIFGSPLYMSPEQCKGGKVDERTDIYSVGCELFEALTGAPPHVGANPLQTMLLHTSEIAPTLKIASGGKSYPPALEAVLEKMLAMEPVDRYQNVDQVREDLADVADEIESKKSGKPRKRIQRKTPSAISQKKAGSRKLLIAASISGALLGVTVFGAQSFLGMHKPSQIRVKQEKAINYDSSIGGVESVKDVLDSQEKVTKALKQAAPIKATIVEENGEKLVQLNFPDEAIGLFSYGENSRPFHKPAHSVEARGVVTAPVQTPLQLSVGGKIPNAFYMPFVLGKIPDDLLSRILVERPTEYMVSENAPTTSEEFAVNLEEILTRIKDWKKLDSVYVCRIPLTKDSVRTLNEMKNLTTLGLFNISLTEKNMVSAPVLTRVKSLYLRAAACDILMETVCHSTALKELSIFGGVRTEKTFALISTLKNLRKLHLKAAYITDAELDNLAKVKSLREVFFENTPFTAQGFATFMKKCPHLKKVRLSNVSAALDTIYVDTDHKVEKVMLPENPFPQGPFGERI